MRRCLDQAEQLLRRAHRLATRLCTGPRRYGCCAVRSFRRARQRSDGRRGRALNEQALQFAERALALEPDLAEGYAAKGNVLENLGRWIECKEGLPAEYRTRSEFRHRHQWYARNLSEEGYVDESAVEIKRAVRPGIVGAAYSRQLRCLSYLAGKIPEALVCSIGCWQFNQVLRRPAVLKAWPW